MDINELSVSLKSFLADTRAERVRLSLLEKQTRKVADCAYKLDRAIDKLKEIQEE